MGFFSIQFLEREGDTISNALHQLQYVAHITNIIAITEESYTISEMPIADE